MEPDAMTEQEESSGPARPVQSRAARGPPGRAVSGRGAGAGVGAGLGRAVRRGSLGLLLALSSPAQPLGGGHRHGVERQEPRQPCPVRRGESRSEPGPPRPPTPAPSPGLPRSFSAGRDSCAPQPSQYRSRSRLSPATFSPCALGSGSRQPSCSRYLPSRGRLLLATTMRKNGRLVQPPSAKRMTTWPPWPLRRLLPAEKARGGHGRAEPGRAGPLRARRTHRAAPWRRHGPRAAHTDDVTGQEAHGGARAVAAGSCSLG